MDCMLFIVKGSKQKYIKQIKNTLYINSKVTTFNDFDIKLKSNFFFCHSGKRLVEYTLKMQKNSIFDLL